MRFWAASPNNLEALNNLAWLLAFQAGKEQEALELIDRAIEIAGSDPTLLDTRAVVYIQLGKPDPALESLRDALAIDPQKAVAYFHLARAYQLADNQGEARKALRRAEELGFKPETIDPLEQAVVAKLRQELALLVQASHRRSEVKPGCWKRRGGLFVRKRHLSRRTPNRPSSFSTSTGKEHAENCNIRLAHRHGSRPRSLLGDMVNSRETARELPDDSLRLVGGRCSESIRMIFARSWFTPRHPLRRG